MRFLIVFLFLLCPIQNYAQRLDSNPNTYRFSYQSLVFKGTRTQITAQLKKFKENTIGLGIPESIRTELNRLYKKATSQPIRRLYKKHTIRFLDACFAYRSFSETYLNALFRVVLILKKDMKRLDYKFQSEYTQKKLALGRLLEKEPEKKNKIKDQHQRIQKSKLKLQCHRWMRQKFITYKDKTSITQPDSYIKDFLNREALTVYKLYTEQKKDRILGYLVDQMIDFYHTQALNEKPMPWI